MIEEIPPVEVQECPVQMPVSYFACITKIHSVLMAIYGMKIAMEVTGYFITEVTSSSIL